MGKFVKNATIWFISLKLKFGNKCARGAFPQSPKYTYSKFGSSSFNVLLSIRLPIEPRMSVSPLRQAQTSVLINIKNRERDYFVTV